MIENSHKHITMEDLERVSRLNVDDCSSPSPVEELSHFYEVEDKIAGCPECQRRLAIEIETKKFFGVHIWEEFPRRQDRKHITVEQMNRVMKIGGENTVRR